MHHQLLRRAERGRHVGEGRGLGVLQRTTPVRRVGDGRVEPMKAARRIHVDKRTFALFAVAAPFVQPIARDRVLSPTQQVVIELRHQVALAPRGADHLEDQRA